MKRRTLIFCIVLFTVGLTAFAFMNWKNSAAVALEAEPINDVQHYPQNVKKIDDSVTAELDYSVATRFVPMKKRSVAKVKSITDFFSKEELQDMVSVKSLQIIVIKNERPSTTREISYSRALTEGQLKLLQSFDYSTNFSIRAEIQRANTETGKWESSFYHTYLTVVPDKQALYISGKEAFINYLRENSKEEVAVVQAEKLRPVKLFFTVNTKGTIENIRLDNHTGYPALDQKMMDLLSKAPGLWKPAENTKGEKVNQELVVTVGIEGMGC